MMDARDTLRHFQTGLLEASLLLLNCVLFSSIHTLCLQLSLQQQLSAAATARIHVCTVVNSSYYNLKKPRWVLTRGQPHETHMQLVAQPVWNGRDLETSSGLFGWERRMWRVALAR